MSHDIEMQLHHIPYLKLIETGTVKYNARLQELRYWRHDCLKDIFEYASLQPRGTN
ncbi:hypothetical protein [Halomontanus rarus]|uniref:hypothetical protein n=1 Tax=Halomontanus rarus TaxID=3034020 RepID=UPI0023E87CAA|nr:hypothetical protein [Halovivax sp. TS33]